MAVSKGEVQITWPTAANSKSIASGGNETSEAATISDTCVSFSIEFKTDNDGTAASGDEVDFSLLTTLGDPDGASTDEFDTTGHAQFLLTLDTNTEDPAIRTLHGFPGSIKELKIYAENQSAGRAITVSATIRETRA